MNPDFNAGLGINLRKNPKVYVRMRAHECASAGIGSWAQTCPTKPNVENMEI